MYKTIELTFTRRQVPTAWARLLMAVGALILALSTPATADIPDRQQARLGGIYKVASSTDPMLPQRSSQEVFLDFGRGVQADKLSGSVSISVRQNPRVRVTIMAWQYFPEHGKLVLGNRFGQGSRNAVAKGVWGMSEIGGDVILERGGYRVVLQPADPENY